MRKWRDRGDVIYLRLQSGVLENKTQVLRDLLGPSPLFNLWRENEEVGRDSLSTFSHFLFISSLSIKFPISKIVIFCRKMLYMALLSRMSQKINIRALRK